MSLKDEPTLQGPLSATYAKKVGVNVADYADLKAAIAALPSTGGTVYVPVGRFPAGNWTYDTNYMSKANVRIVGEKMPNLSATADRLENGSIIYGRFNVFADGFEVRDIGFDCGKYVIDTYYGAVDTHTPNHPNGGGWDAFAFAQPNQTTPLANRRGCHFTNAIGLNRDSQSYGHAFLMEGIDGGSIDNVIGVGGIHAAVVKCQNIRIGRLSGWSASSNNIIFKADSYAAAGNITANSIEALTVPPNTTPWFTPAVATNGLLLNPASASFNGPVQIGSLKVKGSGFGLNINGSAGFLISDVQVGSILADGTSGSMVSGVNFSSCRALRVQIGNLVVNNASQGVGWTCVTAGDANSSQIHINSAQITNMVARVINASQYGRVRIDSLEASSAPYAYYIEPNASVVVGNESFSSVTNRFERTPPTLDTKWGYAPKTTATVQGLPVWARKRALAQLAQGPCRVLCVGDSTTAGVYSDSYTTATGSTNQGGPNSYPAQLAKRLTAMGIPADYSFCLPGHTGNDDSRWSLGMWGYSPNGAGMNAMITSAVAGQTATVTPTNVANSYIVYFYGDTGTGVFTAQATGGSAVSINTVKATGGIYASAVVTAAATASTNTITFTTTSGTVFVAGVEAYDSANPNRVRIMGAGVGGSKATQWNNTNPAGALNFIKGIAPDLSIISLGVNDAGGTADSTSNVLAAVNAISAAAAVSGDVLLMSAVPHDVPTAVDGYNAAYKDTGKPYADLQARWGNSGPSMGLVTTDNTHPNALGYADMATLLANTLATAP